MLISKEKLEKIKSINNDDSDFIIKIKEYLEYNHQYIDDKGIYESVEVLNEMIPSNEEFTSMQYLLFATENVNFEGMNYIRIENKNWKPEVTNAMYYAGKEYERKVEFFSHIAENFMEATLKDLKKIGIIIDISSVSSYPMWNTLMRRRMTSILKSLESTLEKDITAKKLKNIILNSSPDDIVISNTKYDIDFIISFMKKISENIEIKILFIDSVKSNESIYLTNELIKFKKALLLNKDERYEYLYDTTCNDLDEMFSKYGFCNFKENKCVAQRHKTLFSRYPVPKTDGCCFKVVRKCEHNNKDGTCKVKCLPCKLFTCPYLEKLNIGFRASELMLIRAFLNTKQKRIAVYKFYNTKEFLIKKIKEVEESN